MKRLIALYWLAAWCLLGFTTTPTHVIFDVEYDEPTTFSDGTPLTNLQKTTVYYRIDSASVTVRDILASRPEGGGHIVTMAQVPIASGQEKTAMLFATASNTLESEPSNVESMTVDRLSPGVSTFGADISGTRFAVAYMEPTTKSDGSPLNDLLKTAIFYDTGSGDVLIREVVASSPSGGGQVSEEIIVPISRDTEFSVDIWFVAYDLAGNVSSQSNKVRQVLDRLPPAGPQ